jgi:hypothetical protein
MVTGVLVPVEVQGVAVSPGRWVYADWDGILISKIFFWQKAAGVTAAGWYAVGVAVLADVRQCLQSLAKLASETGHGQSVSWPMRHGDGLGPRALAGAYRRAVAVFKSG